MNIHLVDTIIIQGLMYNVNKEIVLILYLEFICILLVLDVLEEYDIPRQSLVL